MFIMKKMMFVFRIAKDIKLHLTVLLNYLINLKMNFKWVLDEGKDLNVKIEQMSI